MTWDGRVIDVNPVGWSSSKGCTSDAVPTSTTNVTVAGLSETITVTSTDDVWAVVLDPDVTLTGTVATVCFVELLVDGAAYGAQMLFGAPANAVGTRIPGSKTYRVTGLSPGPHTLTVRTRMQASSSQANIRANSSTMYQERKQ
jgi:hypothetical protein